jgi:two-component system sensor histidine kinase TtrS
MAAGFAHELNQPLTAIANYAQGCLRRHRSGAIGADDFAHVLELIAAQAQRAGDVIRRIRRFVQKEPTEIRAVDANAAIREAVELVGGEALRDDVDIQLDLAAGLPLVEADAVQLQQVILNLARNAIEAIGESEQPGGRLGLATRVAGPTRVEILVTDSGPGIAEAVQKSIFDPFFTTKASGMGMGLPICRSIIESFGGQLSLDAGAAGQTAFRIVLATAGEATARAV